jgi:hypothetical protein
MKFLCVPCDEPLRIQETRDPDQGSLTVIFACHACGRQVAMLTNPMETQIVRSLDVTIGREAGPRDPMGFIRSALAARREGVPPADPPAEGESRCPFTGIANAAFDAQAGQGAIWTEEAAGRLQSIPSMARAWAQKGIEHYAREKGYPKITVEVMEEIRERLGI